LKYFFSLILLLTLICQTSQLYEGLSDKQLERLEHISENIRCPKCSYGNINSSNAQISRDLKEEIAQLIIEGYQDDDIFKIMEDRYGNYINLQTKPKDNLLLYLLPLAILVISILFVTIYTIKKPK
tara:strand:+ start:877 stop:1254 length:378 start_codon:yes stop_codon:yes gene_type:complete